MYGAKDCQELEEQSEDGCDEHGERSELKTESAEG